MEEQKKLVNDDIAHKMAEKQREIGIGEFFARNRHLLGFDNTRKALLTVVREAVDNSLDACEEANILPEISVELIKITDTKYRVIIEDNGPGIIKEQVGKIFGKLLYGSKFHRLKMSRGQQGIGISACVLYSQLTTGKPAIIKSKTKSMDEANVFKLTIDTKTNKPIILSEEKEIWYKDYGTHIAIDLEAKYVGGSQSVDEYLKQCAISNPHATIIYTNPNAEQLIFPRATEVMPQETKEIKPHPHGVELGILINMLKANVDKSRTLQSFLTKEFSRVSDKCAKEICENAGLFPNQKPDKITRGEAEKLVEGIKKTKIVAPSADCIAPIGEDVLEKGMKKEINAEFYKTLTRSPSVYKGNPFIVEVGIAYGGAQPKDKTARLLRFANRVPLQYQLGACATNKATSSMSWKSYGLSQSSNSLPVGPLTIVVHIASVWVPYTSESKEAIAHYPEILKEIKLALQTIGRDLGKYLLKKKRVGSELKKRDFITKFIPHISDSLIEILSLGEAEKSSIEDHLKDLLEQSRGSVEDVSFDPTKNELYDESFANIGNTKNEEDEEEDY